MRELEFRGKLVENEQWVYGDFAQVCYEGKSKIEYPSCDDNDCDCHYFKDVIPETVGQYAGLKDKNGKGIYEGDILKIVMENGVTTTLICKFGTVKRLMYENVVEITGFYFERMWDGKNTFPIVNNYLGKSDLEIMEVIGNIHDNPELLGTGE